MAGEVIFEMVAEMKRGFFDVPLPEDITAESLIDENGAKPFLVTLPFIQKGVRSGNGVDYTAAIAESIVRQAGAKRPEGGFGHIKAEDVSTRYDPPAIRCLSAAFDEDGIGWGKFQAISNDAKTHFVTAMKHKAPVGLSIWGKQVRQNGALVDVELQRIDIADPARIGVKSASAVPLITAEMQDEATVGDGAEEDTMTDNIAEMTAQRNTLQEQVTTLTGQIDGMRADAAIVSEMRGIYGADADLLASIRADREQIAEMATLRRTDLDRRIAEMVSEQVKPEKLRSTVRRLVKGAASVDDAKAIVSEFLADPETVELARTLTVGEMGPSHSGGGQTIDDKEAFKQKVLEDSKTWG